MKVSKNIPPNMAQANRSKKGSKNVSREPSPPPVLNDVEKRTRDTVCKALQQMMTSSKFVLFTKESSLSNKGRPKVDNKNLLSKFIKGDKLTVKELDDLCYLVYDEEDWDTQAQMEQAHMDNKREIKESLISVRLYELQKAMDNPKLVKTMKRDIIDDLQDINENVEEQMLPYEEQSVLSFFDDTKKLLPQAHIPYEKMSGNEIGKQVINMVNKKNNELLLEKHRADEMLSSMEVDDYYSSNLNLEKNNFMKNNNIKKNNNNMNNNNGRDRNEIQDPPGDNNNKNNVAINQLLRQRRLEKTYEEKNTLSSLISTRNNISAQIIKGLKGITTNSKVQGVVEKVQTTQNISHLQLWKYINEQKDNFNQIIHDINTCIQQQISYNNNDPINDADVFLASIYSVIISIANRVNEMANVQNLLWQYMANENQINNFNEKLGNKAKTFNKRTNMRINKLQTYMNNGDYVKQEEWNKMSNWDKISKRFRLTDKSQFPPVSMWKTLNDSQKKTFLKKYAEFRVRRTEEFLKMNENNSWNIGNVKYLNNFQWYLDHDSRGNLIFLDHKDLVEAFGGDESYNNYLNKVEKLEDILLKCSKENLVHGVFLFRNRAIRTNGKSYSYFIDDEGHMKINTRNIGNRKLLGIKRTFNPPFKKRNYNKNIRNTISVDNSGNFKFNPNKPNVKNGDNNNSKKNNNSNPKKGF